MAEIGQCGKVTVQFDITDEGKTQNLRIFESIPKKGFNRSALKAVEQYEFEKGFPVENQKTIINYQFIGSYFLP